VKSGKHSLITTLDQLRERCIVDPASHCWLWQGATRRGMAVIYGFSHADNDKRVLRGVRAAWEIAHGASPAPGRMLGLTCCGSKLCVNPVHVREFRSYAEIGQFNSRSGKLHGINVDARRAALVKARAARGVADASREVVLAIRSAPADVTTPELAAQHSISRSTAWAIRTGRRYAQVVGP
jgi:hypothetical protein